MGGGSNRLPRATLEQKIQILDFYHQSNRPQSETVDRYKDQLSISTSSFSEWLKNEDELRSRLTEADTDFTKQSRRKVKFKYEKINRAMDLLVQQKLERGESVNEPILREHWSIYAHQYGVDDPKRLVGFSHGWLSQFKKRHGLNKKRMSGSPPNSRSSSTLNGASGAKGPGASGKDPKANGSAVNGGPNGNNANNNERNAPEVYDTAFSTDPTGNPGATATDHDPSSGDFASNPANASSYDIMAQHAATGSANAQFRQPALSYGSTHMNFANFPLYPSQGQTPNQQGQQAGASVAQSQGQGVNQAGPQSGGAGGIPFEYPDSFRNQYTKEAQQQAQAQVEAQARAVQQQQLQQQQQQQHRQQLGGRQAQILSNQHPQQQLGKTGGRNSRNMGPVAGTGQGQGPAEVEFSSNINASDIERFIYMFADRYFHENAQAYPQTVKVFQDFKTTFLNERVQNMRNLQQQQQHQQQIMSQTMNRGSPTQVSNIDDFFIRSAGGLPQPNNNGTEEERPILNNNGINKWKK